MKEIGREHFKRVSQLCKQTGEKLGINEENVKKLELCGFFHDIGKYSIPDVILNKPAKLTDEEYEIIKTHSKLSYKMLKAVEEYSDLAINALYHHERWDGTGYPEGKKGYEIPLFSRIICVADSYDAMISKRPYKESMSKHEAVEELKRCSGSQFDPEIVDIFINEVV